MKYFDEFMLMFSEWEIFRAIILDNIGTLLLNCIGMIAIGMLLYTVYSIFIFKKKMLHRKPKYYNWIVKLYLPILFLGCLYLFGQLGVIRGIYKILDQNSPAIMADTYQKTLGYYFSSESTKKEFIKDMKQAIDESKDKIEFWTHGFIKKPNVQETEDEVFYSGWISKTSDYIQMMYRHEIYQLAMHSAINNAAAKIGLEGVITYGDYKKAVHFLEEVRAKDIEILIQEKMSLWMQKLLRQKYHAVLISHLILILLLLCFPIVEFFIYKKWIEPRYLLKKRI